MLDFSIGGKQLTVNTTDLEQIDYDAVCREIKDIIKQ